MFRRILFPSILSLTLILGFAPQIALAQVDFIDYAHAREKLGLDDVTYHKFDRKQVEPISGPMDLDKPGTRYVLQNDVSSEGTAFVFKGAHITLDLNGHTVEYGTAAKGKSHGVTSEGYHRSDNAVINGRIVQSQNVSKGDKQFKGSSPINLSRGIADIELAGLTLEYHSAQTVAIVMPWGSGSIHHNVVRDKGTVVLDRKHGFSAIGVERGSNMEVYNNFLERVRQGGISPGNDKTVCQNNIINIDSVATNSFGVCYYGQGDWENDYWLCEGNVIRGVGMHPIGIGVVSNTANGIVRSNDVEVMTTRLSSEYKGTSAAAAYRTHWGADNILIENNRFVCLGAVRSVEGRDSWGRAVWAAIDEGQKMLFKDNVITGVSADGNAKVPAVAVCGNNKSSGLRFEHNTMSSSWANVLLADSYGSSEGYPEFSGNEFIRLKEFPGYRTIRSDAKYFVATGVFTDNVMKDGASRESINMQLDGGKLRDVRFMTTHIVHAVSNGAPLAHASVTIKNLSGEIAATGETNDDGTFKAALLDYGVTNAKHAPLGKMLGQGRYTASPYGITVMSGGMQGEGSFAQDSPYSVTVEVK
ncbi:hypothetical protein GM415_03170 [Pseudodesulfovibrio cashew]|uniref:Right handed beta helix domain-containing protein n=1 Tax=Pseudodesulfovibrio cashew TaxID=2678688 RepID=A0A6I6JF55_9BACT|nr:carboxypeptidase-like regulatory domain-containing protein [Pseudodesulfovibrio cashew]QGY39163.1 hypothetical protein GM415_03170 [Pseudodesulfovibrio cashew]